MCLFPFFGNLPKKVGKKCLLVFTPKKKYLMKILKLNGSTFQRSSLIHLFLVVFSSYFGVLAEAYVNLETDVGPRDWGVLRFKLFFFLLKVTQGLGSSYQLFFFSLIFMRHLFLPPRIQKMLEDGRKTPFFLRS